MNSEERKRNIENTGCSGTFTIKQKIYICVSIVCLTIICFVLYSSGIQLPSSFKAPKVSNKGFQLQTINVDGVDYTLAKSSDKSPTKGELLDAAALDSIATPESSSVSGTQSEKVMTLDERQKPIEILSKYVDHLEKNSVYILMNYYSSSTAVINNRLGEEVEEDDTGNLNIINADGFMYSVSLEDETSISSGKTLQTTKLLKRVLELAKSDADHIVFKAVDAGDGFISYQVIFDSPEQFVEVYDNMDEETRARLADDISLQAEQYSDQTPMICFEFIAGDDWAFSVYNTIVLDEEYVLNWYFDGYYEMFDWSLPTDFYLEDLSVEAYQDNAKDLMEKASVMIDVYSNTQTDSESGKLVYNQPTSSDNEAQTPESASDSDEG